MKRDEPKPGAPAKVEVRVAWVANHSTKTELRGGKRRFDHQEDKSGTPVFAHFVEVIDGGIKLDLPPRTCAIGHRLEFELEIHAGDRTLKFAALGIVEANQVFLNAHDNVSVKLTQYDHLIWNSALELFHGEQLKIANLFEKLKGR